MAWVSLGWLGSWDWVLGIRTGIGEGQKIIETGFTNRLCLDDSTYIHVFSIILDITSIDNIFASKIRCFPKLPIQVSTKYPSSYLSSTFTLDLCPSFFLWFPIKQWPLTLSNAFSYRSHPIYTNHWTPDSLALPIVNIGSTGHIAQPSLGKEIPGPYTMEVIMTYKYWFISMT